MAGLMTADDLGQLHAAPPGKRIPYGDDALQFGELSLPPGTGPHPVVVNIHGGCWLAEYDIGHTRALAHALTGNGFAVWNVEYRRVGNPGGGWPGTFTDVSRAVEHLRRLAGPCSLDLSRIVLMGHSAGGQLALWLAGRSCVPRSSEVYMREPLHVCGVVALAPATELPELHSRAIFDGVVGKLIGGSPVEMPHRYAAVTPAQLVPLGVPQILVVGQHDDFWGWNAPAYLEKARAAGERQIRLEIVEGAGHFEVIAPQTDAWEHVVSAVREVLAGAK